MVAADEELVARAQARLGAVLNEKYTLDRVLGIGGMATVYAATHRNGKEFAVKVLHADLSMRTETRTRFLREGYLANRISHPGAVAVLDDDVSDDGAAFLVMELLQGQTIEALWESQRCRLPLQLVAGIGLQLLDVLAAAHTRGLVHRDIKPGNLMLTPEGTLKVLDFGIARLRDMAHTHTTQTGMVLGTPAFMAPEHAMAKSDEIDAQTDLWAVGATLFTLATGELVHEAENTQMLLVKAATVPARSLAKLMPTAPPALIAVVDRALAFEKSDRWANATAMQTALREASRTAFNVVPTAAVLVELLDEVGEHEKTNVLGATDPPSAEALVSLSPSDEIVTGSRAVPPETAAPHTIAGLAPAPSAAGRLAPGHAVERAAGIPAPRESAPRIVPPVIGVITTEAMATDSAMRRTLAKPRGVMAAVMAAGIVGISLVLLVTMRAGPNKNASTAGSASHPTASAAPSPPAIAPAAAASSAPEGWIAVPVVTASAPSVRLVPTPSSLPLAARPHSLGPTASPPAAAAPPPPGKPSCNPPYEFDESGNKHWKRECL
jgi:eukaryotic-like serine/threonine-protein kinase